LTRRDDTFTDKFRTGNEAISGLVYYAVPMPRQLWFIAQVADALYSMTQERNWEQGGSVEVADAVEAASIMMEGFRPLIGTVLLVAWDKIPTAFLECDGATYNRVDYPNLYDVLDSVFIVDADTFTVPNLSARFPLGKSPDFVVGATGGEERHTLTTSEMPSHSHTYTPPVFNVDIEAPGAPDPLAAGVGIPTSTGSTGGGDSHENMPPYQVLVYVIWAR